MNSRELVPLTMQCFSDAQRQLLKTKDALIEMEAQANNTNNDQLIAKYEVQLDTVGYLCSDIIYLS